jgi:hypothetical protein
MEKLRDRKARVERGQADRWPLRRVFAVMLVVTGVLWLAAGIIIRVLLTMMAGRPG